MDLKCLLGLTKEDADARIAQAASDASEFDSGVRSWPHQRYKVIVAFIPCKE